MTDSEHSINQPKGEVTRINALEKEVARLKILSQKQSVKHNKLKKASIFQLLFFVVLLIMMFAYGIIQWPTRPNSKNLTETHLPALSDTSALDTTANHLPIAGSLPVVQGEDLLSFYVPDDGLIFSVQIGAYTGVDMKPFEVNMFSLRQYSYQTINQFTVGLFQNFQDAEIFRDIIVQMGFHDAFIIATLNGRRLPIQEALAIKGDQPLQGKSAFPESAKSDSALTEIPDSDSDTLNLIE